MNNLEALLDPTLGLVVRFTSSGLQGTLNWLSCKSFGGTMWVMYPVSSLANAFFLNPSDTNDFAPKLELEFVIDWSAPLSVRKCCANPIANTETAWINPSFAAFIWKLSYDVL